MPATIFRYKANPMTGNGIYVNLMKLSGKIRQITTFLADFSHLEPLWAAAAGKKGGTPPRGYGHATNGPAWRRGGSNHHHHPDQEPARAALAWRRSGDRRRPAARRRRHLARVQEVRGAQGAGWAE